MSASNPDAIPRASLSDIVYGRIREEILHGDLEDGSVLSQVELAQRYGVSRIPVREALRRLQAESLVIATPYHAYLVRKISPEQVLELADIRVVLEDLALSKRDPFEGGEIEEMRRINALMAEDVHGPSFLALDRQLHHLLVGENTMTAEVLDDVRDRIQRYLTTMVSQSSGRSTAIEEHEQIIEALAGGDADTAREHLRRHVLRSRAFIEEKVASAAVAADAPVPAVLES